MDISRCPQAEAEANAIRVGPSCRPKQFLVALSQPVPRAYVVRIPSDSRAAVEAQ